jgi:hypothetical protein
VKRLFTLLLLACALGACSGDDGTEPEETITEGTYGLRTVDGSPLPVTQALADTISQTINTGNLLVSPGGSFVLSLNITLRVGSQTGTQTIPFAGEWVENNSALLLVSDDGALADAGTLSGRNFYITLFGSAFVFRRE